MARGTGNLHRMKTLIRYTASIYVVSWLIWSPGVLAGFDVISLSHSAALLLRVLGAAIPAVVVLIYRGLDGGFPAVGTILRSCVALRSGFKTWAWVGIALLIAHGVSRSVLLLSGMVLRPSILSVNPVAIVPTAILYFLIGGGLDEEIAWRGTLLGMLRERSSLLVSALAVGVIWILWHLPLFVFPGAGQAETPFYLFVIPVIPLSVILAYVYDATGTIFAAALIHTIGNVAFEIFPIEPIGLLVLAICYAGIAIALIGIHKKHVVEEE